MCTAGPFAMILLALSMLAPLARGQCERWIGFPSQGGQSSNGIVYAVAAWDHDGAGPAPESLVAAGNLDNLVGGVNEVARWDGSAWRVLNGDFSGTIFALCVYRGELYASGQFATLAPATPVNSVARWDGTAWRPLGAGLSAASGVASVRAMTVFEDRLVVGGDFIRSGADAMRCVAAWDGAAWSPVGEGLNAFVRAATVHQGGLYVGGDFTQTGDQRAAARLARWSGARWEPVSTGVDGPVRALTTFGEALAVGGDFLHAGGATARRLAFWDGAAWSTPTPSLVGDTRVQALLAAQGSLIIGGTFEGAGGISSRGLVRWNGAAFSGVPSVFGGRAPDTFVSSLVSIGGDVAVGGNFTTVGEIVAPWIAWLRGGSWSAVGGFLTDRLRQTIVYNGETYGCGELRSSGDQAMRGLARWDGARWLDVPGWSSLVRSGAQVTRMVVGGGKLWVAGRFYAVAGGSKMLAACWDGASWTLGGGMLVEDTGGEIISLAYHDGGIFVHHAERTRVTGDSTYRLLPQRWDGRVWSRLPGSSIWPESTYYFAASFAGRLHVARPAAGGFSRISVLLDRDAWGELPGFHGAVFEMLALDDRLLVGGNQITVGGGLSTLASWDGARWSPLGPDLNPGFLEFRRWGDVAAIGVLPGVYAGIQTEGVLLFDGARLWSPVSPGADSLAGGPLRPLGVLGDDLVCSGPFWIGEQRTDHWATYHAPAPVITTQPSAPGACWSEPLVLEVEASGESLAYQWRRNGIPLPGRTAPALTIAAPSAADAGDYACSVSNACGSAVSDPVRYAPCLADYGCDGFADFFDYADFVADFEAGAARADVNADGFLDFFDYTDFAAAFETGC